MLEQHNKRDKRHLMNLISRRINGSPNFALLIGAGTSVSSGVKSAHEMIEGWRLELYKRSKSAQPIEEWLEEQSWYENDEEYSILFEKLYDQRSQRRIYVEECVKDARPSWGHIYLANMIAQNHFNVVFTPNFDDLLNEACVRYADSRPIVCAHDSAVIDIRVTSARPKIIKLHGDFLYDSIKNTIRETETLDRNMRDKFLQFAREYGLVVIGYSGNDRSIMDILDMTLKGTEGYFPNGLYWCVHRRDKDRISKKFDRLARRDGVYWLETEGFDEFMADLHEYIGLVLPDAVRDPYAATTQRLNTFRLRDKKLKHKVIRKDIRELGAKMRQYEQVMSGKGKEKAESKRLIPYFFLAESAFHRHSYERALTYYQQGLVYEPADMKAMAAMVNCYIAIEKPKKALEVSKRMISQAPTDWRGYNREGVSLYALGRLKDAIVSYTKAVEHAKAKGDRNGLYHAIGDRANVKLLASEWKGALQDAQEANKIHSEVANMMNQSIALRKLGRSDEARHVAEQVLSKTDNPYFIASAYASLGRKSDMLQELRKAIKEDVGQKALAKIDPDFEDYRDDPEFRKVVYGAKKQIRRKRRAP